MGLAVVVDELHRTAESSFEIWTASSAYLPVAESPLSPMPKPILMGSAAIVW